MIGASSIAKRRQQSKPNPYDPIMARKTVIQQQAGGPAPAPGAAPMQQGMTPTMAGGGFNKRSVIGAAGQKGGFRLDSDALQILGAGLRDLDWTVGSGNDLAQTTGAIQARRQGERADAYNRKRDDIADRRYTEQVTYARGRDAVDDQRYDDQTAYARGRDTILDERYLSGLERDDQRYEDETERWQQSFGLQERGMDLQERGLNADLEANRLARAAAQAEAEAERNAPADFSDVSALRREYSGITQDYRAIRDQYNVMRAAGSLRTSQGDLALIVAFTKLQDPGSVAREGEVAMSQSTAGAFTHAANWMERLQRGETVLPDSVRNDFLAAADELVGQYENSFATRTQEYETLASRYNIPPQDVIVGYYGPREEPPPPPPGSGVLATGQNTSASDWVSGARAGTQAQPVRVTTQEQFNSLPSGTVYLAPDGQMRIKP